MRVISPKKLRDFWTIHPRAEVSLRAWLQIVKAASWTGWADLNATFPRADRVGRLTVFDIGGNTFRLIARVEYRLKTIYIRHVLTHADYDKDEWKNDDWA